MPVARHLWSRAFSRTNVPSLPCPLCHGIMAKNGDPRVEEPAHLKLYRDNHPGDWAPEYDCDRFSLHLLCTNPSCGEIVIMAGQTEYMEDVDDFGNGPEQYGESILLPKTVFPAPPLFAIPPNAPDAVRKQLALAFQLYWTDLPSCLARVRTSVELMLDDRNVAKDTISKKTGDVVPLDLSARIAKFKSHTGDHDMSDSLDALRLVGNLGTHETTVSEEALFDAMDVYEDVLVKLYTDNMIQAKRDKLRATKGKY